MIVSKRLAQSLTVTGVLLSLWAGMLLLGTGWIDRAILAQLYAGQRPVLADSAKLVTMLGDGRWVTIVAIAAGLWLMRQRRLSTAVVLLLGTGIGRALTEFQKYGVNRLRPDENPHLVATYNLSFPSGHSANAMMTYLSLALLLPQVRRGPWIAAALALAMAVGASRVMLGVHWPSDVVGGWAYGGLWSLLLVTVDQTLKRNSKTSPS